MRHAVYRNELPANPHASGKFQLEIFLKASDGIATAFLIQRLSTCSTLRLCSRSAFFPASPFLLFFHRGGAKTQRPRSFFQNSLRTPHLRVSAVSAFILVDHACFHLLLFRSELSHCGACLPQFAFANFFQFFSKFFAVVWFAAGFDRTLCFLS